MRVGLVGESTHRVHFVGEVLSAVATQQGAAVADLPFDHASGYRQGAIRRNRELRTPKVDVLSGSP